MKLAVLSGKGGTGKTFVSVNLAVTAEQATYIDCDVEEPNGRLFLTPTGVETEQVFTAVPTFDGEKCTGCRKCVDFCHFHALVFLKNKPKLFDEVCHACGGCALVCPSGAVSEAQRPIGVIELGRRLSLTAPVGQTRAQPPQAWQTSSNSLGLFFRNTRAWKRQKSTHFRQPVQVSASKVGTMVVTCSVSTPSGFRKRRPLGSSTSQSM